jgi:hypothetical protein
VLNEPVLARRVIVSAGFKSGEEIPSEVTPDKVTGEDQQFYLTIIPPFRTAFGFIVILGALIVFSHWPGTLILFAIPSKS